ncbi:MAG: class I SAM-dependent methyltransferase, partial [Flavobacteriaceae bacterium]|nr:class I SAM-dependent methyltransferase [Flavobacteriaceae bacterium]
MSCKHCCGANLQFNLKSAKKDLKRYIKKGPSKPTKLLTEALKTINLKDLSLLDIGGGVGPIPLELIPHGLNKVTNVDASEGYIHIAKSEAEKRNYNDLITSHLGDFTDIQDQIKLHDIVTLDKVICCYPFMDDLLKTSLSKAKKYYALVYPQANWASKFGVRVLNLILKLKGNSFRTFIHSPLLVENSIANAGFKKVYSNKTLLSWHIHLY